MRTCPEAVCGGVGRDESVLQTGTTQSQDVYARIGATSDEAENAPQLIVRIGEGPNGAQTTTEAPSEDTHRQRSG